MDKNVVAKKYLILNLSMAFHFSSYKSLTIKDMFTINIFFCKKLAVFINDDLIGGYTDLIAWLEIFIKYKITP